MRLVRLALVLLVTFGSGPQPAGAEQPAKPAAVFSEPRTVSRSGCMSGLLRTPIRVVRGAISFNSSRRFAAIELVLNLSTAKNLGLTVPQALLLRADRVIE